MNAPHIITPSEIDWERFSERYPEWANVIPAEFYADRVAQYFRADENLAGILLPWSKTHSYIRLRPGELSLWNGVNGHGKSLLLGQIMLSAMAQGQTVCIASMEMKPVLTMARLTRQAAGVEVPSEGLIHAFHKWLAGKLWLYDQMGTVSSKRMFAVLRYCTEALHYEGQAKSINHFVIDSLLKCGINEDDYNRQKEFVDQLSAFAHDTGVHVHLVTHARKGESERNLPGKWDIRGAGAISDLAENVFTLWRNKAKEEEARKREPDQEKMKEPDALLICDKQRNASGKGEGKTALWFHEASQQFVGTADVRPIPMFEYYGREEEP